MMNPLSALDVGPCKVVIDAVSGTGAICSLSDLTSNRPYDPDWVNTALRAVANAPATDRPVLIWQWLIAEAVEMRNFGSGYFDGVLEGTGAAVASHPLLASQNYRDLYAGFDFIYSPGSRHRINGEPGPRDTSDNAGGVYHDGRVEGRTFAAANGYFVGPELNDIFLADSFNQDDTEPRGNTSFGARIGAVAARYLGNYSGDDTTITSAVLQPGGAEIVVSLTFAAARALSCAAPAAVTGFEVAGFRSGFTAAVSANTVVLTKVSGT